MTRPDLALDRNAAAPDSDRLNTYPRLHGVGEGMVSLLIAAAKSKAAILAVAGAWGHSRLGEAAFGAAARAFLNGEDGPNLLLAP